MGAWLGRPVRHERTQEEVAVLPDMLDFACTTYSFVLRRVQADAGVKRVADWLLDTNSRCRVDIRNVQLGLTQTCAPRS